MSRARTKRESRGASSRGRAWAWCCPGRCAATGVVMLALLASGCLPRPPRDVARATAEGVRLTPYVSPYQYEHYLRGELALASGRPAIAAAEFAYARTGSADDDFLRARHAQALVEAGEWLRAERVLSDSLARFPRSVELLLTKARWADAQGREREALSTLEHAGSVAPEAEAPALAHAALLTRLGRGQDAEAVLDAFLTRAPAARVFAARLELALERSDFDDAWRLLHSPGTEGAPDSSTLRRVASLALVQGRADVAARILALLPDRPDVRVLRVHALTQAGRYADAEAELTLLGDDDVGGVEARAELYWLARRADIALELLGAVVARPATATPRQALLVGTCLVQLGHAADGAAWLARVPPESSQAPAARAELSLALRRAGLPALAAEVDAHTRGASEPTDTGAGFMQTGAGR